MSDTHQEPIWGPTGSSKPGRKHDGRLSAQRRVASTTPVVSMP